MASNYLMDGYQCKTLIKYLIKSIMSSSDQQKQLFYGLSGPLKHTCVFFQVAIKVQSDRYGRSGRPVLYKHHKRCDRCFFMSESVVTIWLYCVFVIVTNTEKKHVRRDSLNTLNDLQK